VIVGKAILSTLGAVDQPYASGRELLSQSGVISIHTDMKPVRVLPIPLGKLNVSKISITRGLSLSHA
jgi:hypothetical protein